MILNPSSLGRTGGIAVTVFGGALLLGVLAMLAGADVGIDRFGLVPLGMLAFGGVAVLAGVFAIRSAVPVVDVQMPKTAVRELVGRARVPFGVCTACHAFTDGRSVGCRECGSLHDWVQVDAEHERSTALAALGRE